VDPGTGRGVPRARSQSRGRDHDRGSQRLTEEHTVRADIVPGGAFPDYELTDHTTNRRRLSELQGNDPMILVLSRGHLCPKDHQQHLELAAFHPRIAVAYTRIVTIATDSIVVIREFRASVGAQWTFLSDAARTVQRTWTSRSTRAGPRHPQRLQRPLVLGQAVDRGPPSRSARGDPADPAGLGPQRARAPRGLGRRRPLEIPPRRGAGGARSGRRLGTATVLVTAPVNDPRSDRRRCAGPRR
jgi:peroxiredoxin